MILKQTIRASVFAAFLLAATYLYVKWHFPVSDFFPKKVVKVSNFGGGFGTGFRLSYKGETYIITAAHVCGEDSDVVVDRRFTLPVLYTNKLSDVCVIKDEPYLLAKTYKLFRGRLVNYEPLKGLGFSSYNWLVPKPYKVLFANYTYEYNGLEERVFLFGKVVGGNSGGPILNRTSKVTGIAILSGFGVTGTPEAVSTTSVSISNTIDSYLAGVPKFTDEQYINLLPHSPIIIHPLSNETFITDTDLKVYENAKKHCWRSGYNMVVLFLKNGTGDYRAKCGR